MSRIFRLNQCEEFSDSLLLSGNCVLKSGNIELFKQIIREYTTKRILPIHIFQPAMQLFPQDTDKIYGSSYRIYGKKNEYSISRPAKELFKNNWYFLLVSRWHFRLCRFVTKLRLCSSPATPKFLPDTLSIKIPLISLQLLSGKYPTDEGKAEYKRQSSRFQSARPFHKY